MPRAKSKSRTGKRKEIPGESKRKVGIKDATKSSAKPSDSDSTSGRPKEYNSKAGTLLVRQEDKKSIDYAVILKDFLQSPPTEVVEQLESYLTFKIQTSRSGTAEYFCSGEYTYDRIMGTLDIIKQKMIKEGVPEEEVHKAFRDSKIEDIVGRLDSEEALPPFYTETDEKHGSTNNIKNDASAKNDENEHLEEGCESAEKGIKYKYQYPTVCKSCLMTCCSNCCVPFKNGDKIVKRIMSTVLSPAKPNIPPQVALMCVFGCFNPYLRWFKVMERDADLGSVPPDDTDADQSDANTDDDNEAGTAKTRSEELATPSVEAASVENEKDGNEESMEDAIEKQQKLDRIVAYLENSDISESLERGIELNQQKLEQLEKDYPEEAYFASDIETLLKELEKCNMEKKERSFEQVFKNVINVINAKSVSEDMPGFPLCVGCGELLTILYAAWENLFTKRITEEAYFYAVMLAFKQAKMAREMIFRSPISSKMHILNKYGKEFHPIGCQQRTNKRGSKFTLANQKQDLIKSSVGNLHAYFAESYRRVRNEVIPLLELDETLKLVRFESAKEEEEKESAEKLPETETTHRKTTWV